MAHKYRQLSAESYHVMVCTLGLGRLHCYYSSCTVVTVMPTRRTSYTCALTKQGSPQMLCLLYACSALKSTCMSLSDCTMHVVAVLLDSSKFAHCKTLSDNLSCAMATAKHNSCKQSSKLAQGRVVGEVAK